MQATNKKNVEKEERQRQFLDVFRKFNSVSEGVRYISEACGVRPITVMVWRIKKKSGYAIPERAFIALMARIKSDPPAKI